MTTNGLRLCAVPGFEGIEALRYKHRKRYVILTIFRFAPFLVDTKRRRIVAVGCLLSEYLSLCRFPHTPRPNATTFRYMMIVTIFNKSIQAAPPINLRAKLQTTGKYVAVWYNRIFTFPNGNIRLLVACKSSLHYFLPGVTVRECCGRIYIQ
jgi:hypothetical protein